MRFSSVLSLPLLSGLALAQGDIAALLSSQPDLSTLLELVSLVDGLADKLASSSNITIFAPTNTAFANVPRDIPEGEAIEQRNDSIAIGALLSNHVFKGLYPAEAVTDIPLFAQTLLDSSFVNYRQPFSNFTGGQYNGLVRNGEDVCVLSGEETISTVTEADIKLGDGIVIHKIDTVLSFGAPFQLFTKRAGLLNMNAAVEAAQLGLAFGETEANSPAKNISDFTIFVPNDAAFEAIGSILEGANLETLQAVLTHHMIDSVIFSTALGNVTVPSTQGTDLTITVLPDGTAWVNNARILFPNVILYNGVAHIIDNVLNVEPFDRASLTPSAPAADRIAFTGASPVSELPFSSVTFFDDVTTYTTPALLSTMIAVVTPTPEAEATSSGFEAVPTAGAAGRGVGGALAMGAIAGVAAVMM
ncbi:FAS1 domain-containing protein [Plectosphaerella plurivora]|uniref:FAS1 domain-containing protein n=1 Tax=Plectosphaerella plurivora TaxID=936078 RepID=A0A9P8VIB8_9PEZI|nr:FAS1 domain-containing protein [Plectosphaerella plurivora]